MPYFHTIAKGAVILSLMLLVGAGCAATQQAGVPTSSESENTKVKTQRSSSSNATEMEVTITGGVTSEEDTETESTAKPIAIAGSYESYAPEKLAAAAQGKVILFFHAPWCPTCKAVNTDIGVNRVSIPAGVTILKVDYDSSTALKQKYGVTYQHTFVQVDAEGNMLKKWSGGLTLDDVLSNI